MEVREIAGACGTLRHVVPSVWRADERTVCILLDQPRTGHWLVITLDVRGGIETPAAREAEAS